MKAAYIEQTGPPDVIQVGELPDPTPGPGKVLVRVHASAVNPIDTYIRGGAVAMDLPKPFIPGCDFAGIVEQAGPGATRFKRADRVWGSNQGLLGRQGTMADLASVGEQWLYPLPTGVDFDTAAAAALVGITAHLGLVQRAKIKAGDRVFVNGGSGGVGSTVIQFAKIHGAKVIATAGSAERVKRCLHDGADAAINYKQEDVAARVKELAPGGVDIWWEASREADFATIVPLMAERGRIVVMAGRDAKPELPVGPFYVNSLSLHGFVMFKALAVEQQAAAEDINRWLANRAYRPRIDRVMTLDQAAAAHQLQEDNTLGGAGTLAGKIVVKVTD